MVNKKSKTIAVIVAHPDDETLWAGGTILNHPTWQWFIVCLCRGNDKDRAPKFFKAMRVLGAKGIIGNLNDDQDQKPLTENKVEQAIQELLPSKHFDLIISHNPSGEYSRHIRHEEVSKAVIKLWAMGKIFSHELWTFAYKDGEKIIYPKPIETASLYNKLNERIWLKKYSIITEIYQFEKNSWEAKTTPRAEAFWQFAIPYDAKNWLNKGGILS